MRIPVRPAHAGALLASLVLIVAGCGDSTNAPTDDTSAITQTEAQAVGAEVVGEIAGLSATSSLGDLLNPGGDLPATANPRTPGLARIEGCPALSETPPTDADEDGIPDDLTLTYDPTICILTSRGGQAELTVRGAIRIQDLSVSDLAARVTFDAFRAQFTYNDRVVSRQVDGKVQLETSSAGFVGSDSTRVVQRATGHPNASLTKRWAVTFAADGNDFVVAEPLPDGEFTLIGTLERTAGDRRRSFDVQPVEPLVYDASCVADNRIVAGELNVIFDSNTNYANINIVWNGCGVDPTITLVTGPVT